MSFTIKLKLTIAQQIRHGCIDAVSGAKPKSNNRAYRLGYKAGLIKLARKEALPHYNEKLVETGSISLSDWGSND